MGTNSDTTTSDTKPQDARCGGPDDSRQAGGSQETTPAKEDNNTPRSGIPEEPCASGG